MKSRLVLISAIAAATAGLTLSTNVLADAQAQAASLLNPSHTGVSQEQQSAPVTGDAQAQAAALLGGVRAKGTVERTLPVTGSPTTGDAQAQAAALLSGSKSTARENERTTATREKLGVHPAVAVAQTWNKRGIDPNAFIVGHPAGVQVATTAPVDNATQVASYSVRSGLNN